MSSGTAFTALRFCRKRERNALLPSSMSKQGGLEIHLPLGDERLTPYLPYELHDGDIITLGTMRLRVRLHKRPA